MDPNLFHLDWERVFEALVAIIVLSFLVERALSPLFESRPFILYLDKPGIKEMIALAVSIAGCVWWSFDVISMIVLSDRTTIPGAVVTGAVIAGGSKASIKLFHDVLNIKSSTYERRHEFVAAAAADSAATVVEQARASQSAVVASDVEAKLRKLAKRANDAAAQSGSRLAVSAAAKTNDALKEVQSWTMASPDVPAVELGPKVPLPPDFFKK